MQKAARNSNTPFPDIIPDATAPAQHLGSLEPIGCEYIARGKVRMSLKTETGEIMACTMTSAMMLHMINLSVALLNSHTGQIFRDLDLV